MCQTHWHWQEQRCAKEGSTAQRNRRRLPAALGPHLPRGGLLLQMHNWMLLSDMVIIPTDPVDRESLVHRWTWTLPKHMKPTGQLEAPLTPQRPPRLSRSHINFISWLAQIYSRWDIVPLYYYDLRKREGKKETKSPLEWLQGMKIHGSISSPSKFPYCTNSQNLSRKLSLFSVIFTVMMMIPCGTNKANADADCLLMIYMESYQYSRITSVSHWNKNYPSYC